MADGSLATLTLWKMVYGKALLPHSERSERAISYKATVGGEPHAICHKQDVADC